MKTVLIGIFLVAALGASFAHAQNSSAAAPASTASGNRISDQSIACGQKVSQLTEQLRPLQVQRSGLWSERKMLSQSGGDFAKYKLARLDQELSHVTKQIDSVSGQIDTENRRCEDPGSKHSAAKHSAEVQPAPSSTSRTPSNGKSKRKANYR